MTTITTIKMMSKADAVEVLKGMKKAELVALAGEGNIFILKSWKKDKLVSEIAEATHLEADPFADIDLHSGRVGTELVENKINLDDYAAEEKNSNDEGLDAISMEDSFWKRALRAEKAEKSKEVEVVEEVVAEPAEVEEEPQANVIEIVAIDTMIDATIEIQAPKKAKVFQEKQPKKEVKKVAKKEVKEQPKKTTKKEVKKVAKESDTTNIENKMIEARTNDMSLDDLEREVMKLKKVDIVRVAKNLGIPVRTSQAKAQLAKQVIDSAVGIYRSASIFDDVALN